MKKEILLDEKNNSYFNNIREALQDLTDIWDDAEESEVLKKSTLDEFDDHLSVLSENFNKLSGQLVEPTLTDKDQKLVTQLKGNLELLLGSVELVVYGYANKDFIKQSSLDCLKAIDKEVKDFLDIS